MRLPPVIFILLATYLPVKAQYFYSGPPAIQALDSWADSLINGYRPPPEYLTFRAEPTVITLRKYRTGRGAYPEFDPGNPFNELGEEMESRVIFRFDESGKLTSRSFWEKVHTDKPSRLDSFEYNSNGIVRWISDSFGKIEVNIKWRNGHYVWVENSMNGYPNGFTVWQYDKDGRTAEGRQTGMYSEDTVFYFNKFLANDSIEKSETIQGLDTSIVMYQYFKDSSCVLTWSSSDTINYNDRNAKYKKGHAIRRLSNGHRIEIEYGENMVRGITLEYVKDMLVQISDDWVIEKIQYNAFDDPRKINIQQLGLYGLSPKHSEVRYYYSYDEHNNPTAILKVRGYTSFNKLYLDVDDYWRLNYEYR